MFLVLTWLLPIDEDQVIFILQVLLSGFWKRSTGISDAEAYHLQLFLIRIRVIVLEALHIFEKLNKD